MHFLSEDITFGIKNHPSCLWILEKNLGYCPLSPMKVRTESKISISETQCEGETTKLKMENPLLFLEVA